MPKVQPSVRREGFATTPDVNWDDVGSLGGELRSMAYTLYTLFIAWGFLGGQSVGRFDAY